MQAPVDGHGDAVVAVLLLDRVQITESVVGREDDLCVIHIDDTARNALKIGKETSHDLV